MTIRRGARLDPGQVQDRRGGVGRGGGIAIGGGLGTIVLIAAYLLLGGNPGDLGNVIAPPNQGANPSSDITERCTTGEQARQNEDCRMVAYINSIQKYWSDEFAASNQQYREADTVFYDGVTSSGCGTASSQVGPFYCPNDKLVYLDLGFFKQLQTQFGAKGGPLAQAYVVAHEYGHHVQDLLGLLQNSGGQGENSGSVRTELQADCFAGVWAANAVDTGFLEPITDQQLAQALDAAQAVGDDRIQQQTQGYVNPDSWTHGSAAERKQAFTTGYNSGKPGACNS